ncbi:regulatory protein [Sphingomonas guangdongensis]|uniref:Regulatory protein n=1 Tax=Sphingomonas guangdongensis TaxID=1141890 RepID=A0A285R2F4_9SPHN|nr:RecX family transcriptional regulator [Sphingomonas guangdongensis]SOB88275.1 regulatory protein [Sphingomonas guangdongensis]
MPQSRRPAPPLDAAALERLALRYVERYATTRGKLYAYLTRKLRERGWDAAEPPALDELVGRFAERGYVDDRGFAESRAAAMTRRGYGARRVAGALRAAGIAGADLGPAESIVADGAVTSAVAFARRKRLGPFARTPLDPASRQKALAAFLRAGHDMALARRLLALEPGALDGDDADQAGLSLS